MKYISQISDISTMELEPGIRKYLNTIMTDILRAAGPDSPADTGGIYFITDITDWETEPLKHFALENSADALSIAEADGKQYIRATYALNNSFAVDVVAQKENLPPIFLKTLTDAM